MSVERPEHPRLDGRYVFISASFPEAPPEYSEGPDSRDLLDAVASLARAILGADGRIVFGGHPSISPIVLDVASETVADDRDDEPLVVVYQSRYFSEHPELELPEATRRFGREAWADLRFTEGMGDDREDSLRRMREAMIEETNPVAAVFVGGMDGIFEEWELFRERYPDRPVVPIGSTGGASAKLLREVGERSTLDVPDREPGPPRPPTEFLERLGTSRTFPRLAVDVVRYIDESVAE